VLDVYVREGDFVHTGDPLYRIDSTAAENTLAAVQKTLSNYQKELGALYESYNDLTITAPFAGKLLDVKEFQIDDDVSAGAPVATLVADKTMRLTQYFSYAYEDRIEVGQSAQISVPATMSVLPGKVAEIHKVRRISPEGSVLFVAPEPWHADQGHERFRGSVLRP
jgi:multidrug resistance efflux pump